MASLITKNFLEAFKTNLEQVAKILSTVKLQFKIEYPSYKEQRQAMANPIEFQNLLGIAIIELQDKQKIYYRFPYPLPNGAFLLRGTLRTPGFFIPFVPKDKQLNFEKSFIWVGEIYRLNGTINKWFKSQKKIEELQQKLINWTPKQNEIIKKTKFLRPNFPHIDRTNPLSEVQSIREIRFPTLLSQTEQYPENIPERNKINQSCFGRVCILETSDDEPGEVLYLARGAQIKIKDGKSYITPSKNNLFSYSCSLIPFIQHNKPIRTIIGGRELKQALPLLEPEIPLICTGVEEEIAEESGRIICAQHAGEVIKTNWTPRGGEIKVKRDSDNKEDIYPLAGYNHVYAGEFQGGCYWENIKVFSVGQKVEKGNILAEGCGIKDGKLALGVNLLVAYIPYFGYNFEDAIVISEKAAKSLTSVHVYEEKDERDDDSQISIKVEEGNEVEYGTELTDRIKFSHRIKGKVVRILSSPNEVKIWIKEERPTEVGDKITNRHGNKGVISLILPDDKMPYFYVNGEKRIIDIILNPTSIISRLNLGQILETHFGWVIHEIKSRNDLKNFREVNEFKKVGIQFEKIKEEQLEKLKKLLKETGLDEYGKAEIYHKINGKEEKLGSYVVGYQYFVKLRHLARDKIKIIGKTEKRDPLSYQPIKGNRLSEFGIWALIAHKADNLLQEILTVRSDDIEGSKNLKLGKPLKVFYPRSLQLIVEYLRGLGLEVEAKMPEGFKNYSLFTVKQIQAVKLRRAKDDEIKKWGNYINFTKSLKHPLNENTKFKGIYEIPSEYRPYNIGDEHYELSRHYGKLENKKTKNLQKSFEELIEGIELKSEDFHPRAGKGILDFLQGKEGLFRKGSLAKRIDYSAMGVIVPDPKLKINEIGLPNAVWDELELNEEKPVLVVRHPILHLYGTLAMYPRKRNDFAIGVPPLLCRGFGADFDGDTMMVFCAISNEAQKDLEKLLSTNYLFSSANGELNLHLTQDFILGEVKNQTDLENIKNNLVVQFKEIISSDKNLEQRIFELQDKILKNAVYSGISVSIFDIQELVDYFKDKEVNKENLKKFLREKKPHNSLCLIVLSKARGKLAQLREMIKKIGKIKVLHGQIGCINNNFFNGLSQDEYKTYARFAREVMYISDKAPQGPGEKLREYYFKAGDLLITKEDCKTKKGIELEKRYLLGRVPVEDSRKVITESDLNDKDDKFKLKVRSPIYCKSEDRICAKCYGWDLSLQRFPKIGWRVGVISVQSIFESLYQAELKVIHKDPQEEWENKIKEFEEIIKKNSESALRDFYNLKLNVDSRHFEVIIRAEKKKMEEKLGWLSRASYKKARDVFEKALKEELVDKLENFVSKLLLGQNPGNKPPQNLKGNWIPLANILPPQKNKEKKYKRKKQIWSAFYIDNKNIIFIKRNIKEENIKELKKAINGKTWSELIDIAENKKKKIKSNVSRDYMQTHTIVGPNGKEILLQQILESKEKSKPGRKEGERARVIKEWWQKKNCKKEKNKSFTKLAIDFLDEYPQFNKKDSQYINALAKQIRLIYNKKCKNKKSRLENSKAAYS